MIESWKPNLEVWASDEFNQQVSTLWNNYLQSLPSNWIWSGHSFVSAWLKAYELAQATGEGFIEVIVSNTTRNISHYEWLQGYLLAYEFKLQDESYLTKRRNAERASFNSIRNQLEINKNELIGEVSDFKASVSEWKEQTQENVRSWHAEQKQLVADTALLHSKSFQERISAWTEKVSDLEITYREKLRLDGPATYWKKSAEKFRTQGFYWAGLLVLTSIIGLIGLWHFFVSWLLGQSTPLKLQTLQGVVLFASMVAAFAILIRTFSRLTFSSFHLQRDAEEREQLTHLYLALSQANTVDDESRKIILQALFSRSETGLLLKDSTPAMPGVHDALSIATRARSS